MTSDRSKQIIKPIHFIQITPPESVRRKSPVAKGELAFSLRQLRLSVARTQTIAMAHSRLSREKRARFNAAIGDGTMRWVEAFLQENSRDFSFDKELVESLEETPRASFAGEVGAAIADILMDDLGHLWRASAREVVRPRRNMKIPDFAYDPGPNAGYPKDSILLVEAKGSLSSERAKIRRIVALTKTAYTAQVNPYMGRSFLADPLVTRTSSSNRKLLAAGGYAVAFGAVPGAKSTLAVVAAALRQFASSHERSGARAYALSAASTRQQPYTPQGAATSQPEQHGPAQESDGTFDLDEMMRAKDQFMNKLKQAGMLEVRGGGDGGGVRTGDGEREERSSPNGRIAFANYEAVFELLDAWTAADRLRQILSGRAAAEEMTQFQDFTTTENEDFLSGPYHFGSFAIYRPIAEAVLRAIYVNPERPPENLSLPTVPSRYREVEEQFLSQGDGFAITDLRGPSRRIRWDFRLGQWA